jgi:transcriptional regulator with PAS, ATPase and Fis domain
VKVTAGPDAGTTFEAAGVPVRIGTGPDNDIVLTDDTVSRHHCEIEMTAEGARVRDRGSTNGVMLGALKIHDAIVPRQAALALGDTTVTIAPFGATVEREQVATDRFGDVLGRAPRMRELFGDLERIAVSDVSLLIEGETGTGKDLVAESVHHASPRAEGPFVVFDCGAIAPSLAESELFGHVAGSFTGARTASEGLIRAAEGGTLLLDEIGELPKELQAKLLRALEKRQIRRVGGDKTLDVDVRVVAATNRNLRAEVQRGAFREDLYFRLVGACVTVPPLRDRMEDLPFLTEHFLRLENASPAARAVPRDVWDLFAAYRWPGNVRELRNAVRRLLVMPDRPFADSSRAPPAGEEGPVAEPAGAAITPLRHARREAMDAFERNYTAAVLAAAQGNVTRAASLAEVSRQMMQKLIRKHGRGAANADD